MLKKKFFDKDAEKLAIDLIGKVIRKRHGKMILSAMIIETECYYIEDKGSHASLGFTEKREALFMDGGTIYMYYARGKDSLNFSAKGAGNAVLIKSGLAYSDEKSPESSIEQMQKMNPKADGSPRPTDKLCSGQTLLCKSMGIKLNDWDKKNFVPDVFYVEDVGYKPEKIIQTIRLGIPKGRDEHLPYRFVDYKYAKSATKNPLTSRNKNYSIITL
jgi:DNA-3-methyladenine glycosylase